MDKESEEGMAPALHNADHEAAGTIISSLKYPSNSPPSSIQQSETDTFQQYNGVLSSHSQIEDEQMLAKSKPFMTSLNFESPSKTIQIGSSGDFGSALSYFEGAASQKAYHISGSGDVSKYMKSEKSKLFTEDFISSANSKKVFTKTAATSTLLDPAKSQVVSNISRAIDTAEVHKLLLSIDEKVSSVDLPTSNDNATSSSITHFSQKVDKKFNSTSSPLLVNVDKHNSVNPQIIHTTSITTSPLAVLNLPQLNQDKNDDRDGENGKTQHKNNLVKSLSVSASDVLSKRNGQTSFHLKSKPRDDSDKQSSIAQSPNDISPVSSNTFCGKGETLKLNNVSADDAKISVTISSSPHTVMSQTELSTKTVGIHTNMKNSDAATSISEKLQCQTNEVTTSATVSDERSLFNDSNTDHATSVADWSASISTHSTRTFEANLQIETTSNLPSSAFQASMSSITQTTPVYKCNNSISTYDIREKINNATSIIGRESEELKPQNDLSLRNVSHLKNLAHGLVTGQHMQLLPLNVTNTLQELAASLAGKQAKETEEIQQNVNERTNSEKPTDCNKPSEEKQTDRHFVLMADLKKLENQHHSQLSEISKCKADLELRISSLQLRLNRIRAAGVSLHSRKHLPSFKPSRTRSSWKQESLSRGLSTNNHELHVKNEPDHMGRDGELKSPRAHLSSDISSELGVLKKELRLARVKVDPELTESSSDEDEEIASRKNLFASSESLIDSGPRLLPINSPAAWSWARDRLSIAHRWTWLNAQVTGLEFKIKQHRELQKQLRTAKGEVSLGNQILNNKSSLSPMASKIDEEPSAHITSNCDDVKVASSSDSTGHSGIDGQTQSVGTNDEVLPSCARVRPLSKQLRHRKVLRASDVVALSKKKLKPPTVPNENAIMRSEQFKHTPFHRADGRSRGIVHSTMRVRAAMHDHSYHRILSTPEDVPISVRLSGHLLTSNKQFASKLRRAERRAEKRNKRKRKEAKYGDRTPEKVKNRPRSATVVLERADKLMRSMSTLQRNTSFDDRSSLYEHTKRRSTNSLSELNKRSRITSFDSDIESLHYRSEAGTPVFDASASHHNSPQYQAVLKRKRANDQAYDINNIVIPHGLTSTRIEKLQYKEILTPGWRTANTEDRSKDNSSTDDNSEDVSDELFKCRHDRHEILEKKKYMSYMERNMNKRSGARTMSRANLPLDDPPSFYPSYRSSPISSFPPADISAPASPEQLSPSIVLRSRRSSSEVSIHSNVSSLPTERHRGLDSVSSDDGIQKIHRENSIFECWERRSFPLDQYQLDEMKNDPVVFLKKLPKEAESGPVFQPITGSSSGLESHVTPKQKLSKLELVAPKRRRNHSHTSSMSRDEERHSDDSVMSSRSLHRVRSGASDGTAPESVAPTYSQRKRHKATLKEDFYYYSGLESSSESDTDDDSVTSGDSKLSKSASRTGEEWVSRPVSEDSTPKRSPSGDEQTRDDDMEHKPPLLLKVKKKFLFK